MPILHAFNCAALAFGPHAVYYKATPLAEYDTFNAVIRSAAVYMATTLIKLVLWATFLKVAEDEVTDGVGPYDPYQEMLKAAIGCFDVAGLYYALTQVTYRNISYNHKFQAVGLGWAVADSLVHRLAPFWVGARGMEFTWDFLLQAVESNAQLVLTISLAALGSLMWLRKNKPPAFVPLLWATSAFVVLLPSFVSYLKAQLLWDFPKIVGFELSAAAVVALVTWRIFAACQRPSL
eukprot:jgi/Mesen1/6582/ME000336S05801